MATSIGTAWIQIKPSLKGVSNDIKAALGDGASSLDKSFNSKFKSSFLVAAKSAFSQGFGEFARRSDEAFRGFMTSAKVAFAAVGVLATATFKSFVDSASELQSLRASFEALTGSVKDTNSVMNTLYSYGKETAFDNKSIQQSARMFLANSVAVKDLMRWMQNLGDLAGATGADLEALALPLTQAIGKGKLQTQDWYQIVNQGAGGFQKYIIAALGAGHSTKTFQDDLSDGAITVGVLEKALSLASAEGEMAFQGAIKQSKTFAGRMSNLKEGITNVGLSILGVDAATGKVDPSGLFAKLSDAVEEATKWLDENKEAINQWLTSAGQWITDNKEMLILVGKAIVAFKALQIATGGVRSVMNTLRPYGKILSGVFKAGIGGIQTIIGKFKGLGKVSTNAKGAAEGINKISKAAKSAPKKFQFGDSIASFFKNIEKVLKGVARTVVEPLKILFKGVGAAVAGFFKALASPQVLLGVVVFAAAAGAIALAILMIGSAIGKIAPGLKDFLDMVIIPFAMLLLTVVIVAINKLTDVIIRLTNEAVIPLIEAVSGGLTEVFTAIGEVIEKAGDSVSKVVDSIANGIAKIIDSIGQLLRDVGGQDWYSTGYNITRNFTAGLIDGLIDLLQDSLNNVINAIIDIPGIGAALKAVGVESNPVNLSKFKLGKRAMGGPVFGPGGPTSDSIPMALSDGEYVIRTAAARKIGYRQLDELNSTGRMSGGDTYNATFRIDGYNKDPKQLAEEISRIISLNKSRVIG